MSFDMSLARGLDYYTGIIYEAITEASAPPTIAPTPSVPAPDAASSSTPTSGDAKSQSKSKSKGKGKQPADTAAGASDEPDENSVGVGSIAAGGRYDNLVGMFASAAGKKGDLVPCVGVSIGVERVYSIMEMRRRGRKERVRAKETEVFVLALGGGLVKERMQFAKMLRDNGIKVGHDLLQKPLSLSLQLSR
jgi:histidyl-tRNA synthetase